MHDPTRLLILDSGAFTVWTQNATIDLDEYIDFCEARPGCSYYVNLDVIPGKPGDKKTLTPDTVEASCKQGWANYKRMIECLPMKKVIPVFHQGDPIKWLDKYLSFGVPYIGISPANDRRTSGSNYKARFEGRGDSQTTKLQWIRSLRSYLFNQDDTPTVKTHGFAVTSYDLMKAMAWHSVDSASWKLAGAWGAIYVPSGDRAFNFEVEPQQVRASGSASKKLGRNGRPAFSYRTLRWLEECGVPVGAFKTKQVKEGYKLNRDVDEIWMDKKARIVLVPTEKGIVTSVEERLRVNAEFIKRANMALEKYVRHIYFAGALMPYDLEYNLGRRLLSFYHTRSKGAAAHLDKHCSLVQKNKERKRRESK